MAKKTPKTLKEVDEKTLGELYDKHLPKEEELKNINAFETKKHSCPDPLCGGRVEKVIPEIKMGDLVIFECTTCGERKYL
jgi:predicted transcriptional regulator